jgi:hypothetical protein
LPDETLKLLAALVSVDPTFTLMEPEIPTFFAMPETMDTLPPVVEALAPAVSMMFPESARDDPV